MSVTLDPINSFGGVNFYVQGDVTKNIKSGPMEAQLVVDHIAGGNITIVHNLGVKKTGVVSYVATIQAADKGSWEGLVGQNAALILFGASSLSAILQSISEGRYVWQLNVWEYNVTFLVLG